MAAHYLFLLVPMRYHGFHGPLFHQIGEISADACERCAGARVCVFVWAISVMYNTTIITVAMSLLDVIYVCAIAQWIVQNFLLQSK